MKKAIFSLLCICFAGAIHAQDLKDAKSAFDKKQYDKAKTEIDGFLAKSPDDAEGLYYKAKIYAALATSDQFKSLAPPDALDQAFEAARKAMGDGKDPKMMIIAMKDQYAGVFGLYTDFYQDGANAFNAGAQSGDKSKFTDAMNDFIKSDSVGQYIARMGWSKIPAVDTVLVLNIGKAAINAGNDEVAMAAFKKLADSSITGTKEGDNSGYVLPYEWLLQHYMKEKDDANVKKYDDLGKKLFPKVDYFYVVMPDYYNDKKDYAATFAAYNDMVTQFPDSVTYRFNYANDIFGYVYNGDEGVTPANKDSLMKVMGEQLEKAHSIDANDVLTNWLYAQYYYNQGVDARDSASKVKDAAAKKTLTDQATDLFNKAIPYAQAGLTTLENNGYKKADRSHYKSIVDLTERIYQSLGQNDKVKQYDAMYDAADKKFVND